MEIDVAIPSSFTENLSSLMQRSFAVANLARAAACFGVNTIYIYPDPLSRDRYTYKEVIRLLRYLITPPYLKKEMFGRDPILAYVGALPPLKLKIFKEKKPIRELDFPEYRVGYYLGKKRSHNYLFDVGLDKLVVVRGEKPPRIAIVKIVKNLEKYLLGEIVSIDEAKSLGLYKGYKVVRYRGSIVNLLKKYPGTKIGLSKYGKYIGEINVEQFKKTLKSSEKIMLVFGSHSYGLIEILKYYEIDPDIFDYFLNLVYEQKVDTIRIEEALWIGLSIVSFIINQKS